MPQFFWGYSGPYFGPTNTNHTKNYQKITFGALFRIPPQNALQCSAMYWSANAGIIHSRWVKYSQVPRLTWKSVGWTNPPGAGKKTLESHNSKFFNGDHQKLMLIGKLRTWRGYWCWCHSLIFIGCPARSGFRSPPVCNLGHLPFATSLYCCNHLYFSGFSSIFAWHFFPHYCTKHLQWKKTVQAGEVGGPLQFLGDCSVIPLKRIWPLS